LTASPAGASASPAASPATLPTAPATSTGIGSVIAASLTTLSALTTLLLTTTARGVGVRPSGCGHKLGLQVGILRVAERGPRHGFHRRQRRHRARRFITIATIRRTTILNATTTTRLAPRGLIERRSRPSRPSRRLLPTRTRTHRRGVLVTTATTTTTTTTTHHRRIHHTSSIRMIPANVSSTILARPRARASGDNLGPRRHDVPPDAPRAQTHTYIYINTMSRPIALDTLHTHVTTAHVTIHSSQYDGKRDGRHTRRATATKTLQFATARCAACADARDVGKKSRAHAVAAYVPPSSSSTGRAGHVARRGQASRRGATTRYIYRGGWLYRIL
jgi:hypothetical protein